MKKAIFILLAGVYSCQSKPKPEPIIDFKHVDTSYDIHIGHGKQGFRVSTRDSVVIKLKDTIIVKRFDSSKKSIGLDFVP